MSPWAVVAIGDLFLFLPDDPLHPPPDEFEPLLLGELLDRLDPSHETLDALPELFDSSDVHTFSVSGGAGVVTPPAPYSF